MLHLRLSLVLALALACAGTAAADIWNTGDLTTYTQAGWGGDPTRPDPGAALLVASFNSVYGGAGGVIVGSPSKFIMGFTDAASVLAYIPSVGPYAPLNGSSVNPQSTDSGAFGGEVLGLEFNVDFSDAGLLPGSSGLRFGDLVLENFTSLPVLNGMTVRQYLGDVNTLLSGGSSVFGIADIDTTLSQLNASFADVAPSAFAQAHLVAPTSASTVPEPSTWALVTAALLGMVIRRRRPYRASNSGSGATFAARSKR